MFTSILIILQSFCFIIGLPSVNSGAGSAAVDSVCETLSMSGAVYQPSINGHFELDRTFGLHCGSRPVWKQTNSNSTFIYFIEDGYDGWMIGASSCYSWGNFLAGVQSDAQVPSDVTETWKESVPSQGLVDSPNMSVKCIKLNRCYNSPCQSGSTCIQGATDGDDVTCVCVGYYDGKYCDEWSPWKKSTAYGRMLIVALVLAGIVIVLALVAVLTVIWQRNSTLPLFGRLRRSKESGDKDTGDRASTTLRYKRLQETSTQTNNIMPV